MTSSDFYVAKELNTLPKGEQTGPVNIYSEKVSSKKIERGIDFQVKADGAVILKSPPRREIRKQPESNTIYFV